MSVTIFDDGFVHTTAHTKELNEGVFNCYWRIPRGVKTQFNGKTFREVSLGTRDLKTAIKKAAPMVAGDITFAQCRAGKCPCARDGAGALYCLHFLFGCFFFECFFRGNFVTRWRGYMTFHLSFHTAFATGEGKPGCSNRDPESVKADACPDGIASIIAPTRAPIE